MFFTSRKRPSPPTPPAEIAGVRVRPSARARRMALQVDSRLGEVVLTLPRRASVSKAEAFIAENSRWIERHRAKAARDAAQKITPGARISFLDREYTVTHAPGRGASCFSGDAIVIRGQAEHFARRLRDFLKKESAAALARLVQEKTARLELKTRGLRIIDPKTRWGSCTPDGRIMLSWRLALAPGRVMDYVVAHEVAHRIHHDHSRRFWKLCAALTHADVAEAKAWIRQHGDRLMRCI